MKKNWWYKSGLVGLTAGCWLGLVFGFQQSSSIILSSLHDLANFPINSLWATIFNVFLAQIILVSITVLVTVIIGFLMKKRKSQELTTIPASFGLAFGLVITFFVLSKFAAVVNKKIGLVIISLAGIGSGLVTGFLFFTMIQWWQKKKKLWFWLWRSVVISALVSFSLTSLVVFGLVIHRQVYGVPGFPKRISVKAEATPEKLNVLLITIDAFRADHAGVYGYSPQTTPYLDELAKKGVLFENAYTNAPWTFPSFASEMTSRYPTELNTSVEELSTDEVKAKGRLIEKPETLAERMATFGYSTQAILTNEWLSQRRGFDQGFENFVNVEKMMPYHYNFHFKNSVLAFLLNKIPTLEGKLESFHHFLFGPGWQHLRTPALELTPWIENWLENHQKERFFLWVHLIDPHNPYDPLPEFSPQEFEISLKRMNQLREISARDPEQVRWREIDKEAYISLYDGDVSQADAGVDDIWQKLNDLGLNEKTILIITADHGEEFWDHEGLGHGRTFYDETVKIPLLILGPGIEPRQVSQRVSLLDLFPTIIDLIGEKKPKEVMGRSLKPLIEGKNLPVEPIILEANSRGDKARAIIWGDYKLIHNYFTDEEELYNLKTDLNEKNNLIKVLPEIANQLRSQLFTVVEESEKNYQEFFKESQPVGPPLGDVVGY